MLNVNMDAAMPTDAKWGAIHALRSLPGRTMSHEAIGRIVNVSHQTVGRELKQPLPPSLREARESPKTETDKSIAVAKRRDLILDLALQVTTKIGDSGV